MQRISITLSITLICWSNSRITNYEKCFRSIVGYVQIVNEMKKIKNKDGKELLLFKFVMNNNKGSKISCIAWNEGASKFANTVKINQVSK